MTDREKRLTELLKAALVALNAAGNRELTDHPEFKDTYALAFAISQELRAPR